MPTKHHLSFRFVIGLSLLVSLAMGWLASLLPSQPARAFQEPGPTLGLIFYLTPPPPTPVPTDVPDHTPPHTTLQLAGLAGQQGWYRSAITVTFQAVDDWVGLGGVYYRLDGNLEWSEAEPGSGALIGKRLPITVAGEGKRLLAYYAEDNYGNHEAVHTTTLKIDLTPPTVTHTLTGTRRPDGWFNWPVIVTLKGQDALSGLDHYEVNLNNTGWLTVTTSYTITAAGYHYLAYRAVDLAGNVSPVQMAAFGIGQPKSLYLPFILKLR